MYCIVNGCIDNGSEISGSGQVNDLDGDGLSALNYNPLANTNDGSCVSVVTGCMDELACNYNFTANTDDNSCLFPSGCETCSGETDGSGTIVDNDNDDDDVCDSMSLKVVQMKQLVIMMRLQLLILKMIYVYIQLI